VTGVDSNVFIYVVEDHPEFSAAAKQALIKTVRGGDSLCVSSLVITEILSGTSNLSALKLLEASQTVVYDFTKDIAVVAGNLRRQHPGLKTPDAIHVATAITAGASSFITNDKKLLKFDVGIGMVPLVNFAG